MLFETPVGVWFLNPKYNVALHEEWKRSDPGHRLGGSLLTQDGETDLGWVLLREYSALCSKYKTVNSHLFVFAEGSLRPTNKQIWSSRTKENQTPYLWFRAVCFGMLHFPLASWVM